jgi:hypothetical protein
MAAQFARIDGLPGGDRTPDPQLRRLLLYPTELRTVIALRGPKARKSTNKIAPQTGVCEAKIDGRSTRIRTLDPLVPNQVRYQTAPHSEALYSNLKDQRFAYWPLPKSISRSLSPVMGLREAAKTWQPRCTAGRLSKISNQRFRAG